jgi:hypothetical protein
MKKDHSPAPPRRRRVADDPGHAGTTPVLAVEVGEGDQVSAPGDLGICTLVAGAD